MRTPISKLREHLLELQQYCNRHDAALLITANGSRVTTPNSRMARGIDNVVQRFVDLDNELENRSGQNPS